MWGERQLSGTLTNNAKVQGLIPGLDKNQKTSFTTFLPTNAVQTHPAVKWEPGWGWTKPLIVSSPPWHGWNLE